MDAPTSKFRGPATRETPWQKLRRRAELFSNGPMWERSGRVLALLTAAALCAWFVFLIRRGLASWFDGDDMMNLHYYWVHSWPALLKANLMYWSNYYRPAGGLFYRAIYDVWGFDPLPFRIAAFALILADFWLLAAIVRRLTGSHWCVLLSLLLVGIHGCFSPIYFDTGMIYDVLAYAFFWAAFWCYLRVRQAGRIPGWKELALPLGLFVMALNAKEIAVGLPVAVALYELVWRPPRNWKPAALFRWVWSEGRFAAIGALLDIIYIIGKLTGPESYLRMGEYRPHVSLRAYLESSAHFISELSYDHWRLSPWQMAVLLAGMLAVAAVTRRRCLLWATGFAVIGVLPVAFIQIRGGFAYLVPSVGWAVYVSGLLEWLADVCVRRRRWLRLALQALVLAALFLLLQRPQSVSIRMHGEAAQEAQDVFRRFDYQLHALIGTPRRGARILLLSDGAGHNDWDTYFLIRLSYGDQSLTIDRKAVIDEYHMQVDRSKYDFVLDWEYGHFVRRAALPRQ